MFDAGWLMVPQNVTLPTLELLECCGSAERFEGSMLFFTCNSICSKHLDRTLQTSMFLMSSSRHVKGGYDW